MTEQGLRKRKGSWSRVGKWEECRTRIRVGGEGGDEQFIYHSHSLPHSHHSAQNFYTAGPCPVSSAPPKRRTTHSANRSPDSIGPSPSHFPFRSFIPPPLFFFLPRPASLPSDPPYRPDDLDQGGALQALRHPGSLHSPTLTQLPLTPPPIHVNQPVHYYHGRIYTYTEYPAVVTDTIVRVICTFIKCFLSILLFFSLLAAFRNQKWNFATAWSASPGH